MRIREDMKIKSPILCGLSIALFAMPCVQAEPGSFLIGASGGFAGRSSNMSLGMIYTNPAVAFAGIPPTYIIEDYDDSGLFYGFLAGYQAQCENWILGLELNVDWEKMGQDHPFAFSDTNAMLGEVGLGWNGNFKYQREVVIGLTARMGYVFESLMYFMPPVYITYLRAGVEASKDTFEASYSGHPPFYPVATSSKTTQWPLRFVVGGGVEFPIRDTGIGIRMEYNFHSAGQTLETDSFIIDNTIINPTFNSAMNPIIQSVKLAVVYNI